MRIGINALFLQKPVVGAGQYTYYLLEGLDAYDRRNEYVLLSPRFRKAYQVRFPQLTSDRFRNVEVWTKMARPSNRSRAQGRPSIPTLTLADPRAAKSERRDETSAAKSH